MIFLLGLVMFGVPLSMLSYNSEDELVGQTFTFWPVNLIVNQYLLSLGDFNLDNFDSHPQAALCYTCFIMATFISSVTMLNMIIAIMGDTFERVIENRQLNSIKTKLGLMGELSSNLKSGGEKSQRKHFLFVVTPDEVEEDDMASWEGTIKQMTRVHDRSMQNLKTELDKHVCALRE